MSDILKNTQSIQKSNSMIFYRLQHMMVALPYGLEKMITLMDFEESLEIKTACVPLHCKPKIIINPEWVQKNCETDEKLFMLIQHELHHVLLGHTRLFDQVTPSHNIACDAIINSMLSRGNPSPEWTALFRDQYAANIFPYCLLRPPENFPKAPSYPKDMPQTLQELITKLYYSNKGTFHEVFEEIQEFIVQFPRTLSQEQLEDIVDELMGNHEDQEDGITKNDDPDFFNIIREIVEAWPQPKKPIIGRSQSEFLMTDRREIVAQHPHQIIRRAIQLASIRNGSQKGIRPSYQEHMIQQFLPTRDRRGFAIAQNRKLISMYNQQIPRPHRSTNDVHIYIDVSGSMSEYVSYVLNAVYATVKDIQVYLYYFSTQIYPTNMKELKSGMFKTTQGTSGAVVLNHIIDNQIESAVILTDGYVGIPAQKYHHLQKSCNIQVVLTPNGHDDLEIIATKTHYLSKN